MSVTLHLWRPRPDVTYKGYYLDFCSNREILKIDKNGYYGLEKLEKELGAPLTKDGHWPTPSKDPEEICIAFKNWQAEQEKTAWSDGKKHHKIDITGLNSTFKGTFGWRRIRERLYELPVNVFYNNRTYQKYIAVDEVAYEQGWFLKKRFFHKKNTIIFCTTKEQMERFFKRYIDIYDERGKQAVQKFLDTWEDGMVFECAW